MTHRQGNSTWTRGARAMALLVALVQLLVPSLVGVADARLESATRRAAPVAHVEAHGSPHCARVHPTDCALCQAVATTAAPARAACPLPAAVAAALPARVARLGSAAGGRLLLARSRAPPAA